MAEARPRRRIFRRYVLSFSGLAISLSLLAGVVSLGAIYRHAQTAAHRVLEEKAHQAAATVEDFVGDVRDAVSWSAPTNLLASHDRDTLRHLDFVRILRHSAALVDLSYIDPLGRERLHVSRLVPDVVESARDRSDDPAFLETRAHGSYLGPVFFHKGSEPFMTVGVADAGGNPGVTLGTVNLKAVWDAIAGITVGHTGYAYVVDQNALLVSHPNRALVLGRTDVSSLAQLAAARDAPHRSDPPLVAAALDGREVMFAASRIACCNWIIFVEQPVREALAPVRSALMRSAGVFVAGLLLALTASLILARQMIVPIQRLRDEVVRIGHGQLDRSVVLRTGDELEDLAEQFNGMVRQLALHRDHLESLVSERTAEALAARERLLTAINTAPDALLILDPAGTVAVGNDRCAELLRHDGLVRIALGGSYFEAVDADHTLPAEFRGKCRALHRNGAPFTDELELGAGLWVEVSGRRMPSGGFVIRFADVSSYRQAEAVLQQALEKERELSEIQRNFVAMTSHQFRTPLSVIDSCAQRLARRRNQLTSEDVMVRTRDIRNAVARMTRLMESTLSLSRIDAGTISFEQCPVDFRALIQAACTFQCEIAPTHHITADLGDLPSMAMCDPVLMEQVVVNLLSNAVKFSPDGSVVTVRGWREGGNAVFAVTDQGIGIPADEIDRVFQRFFRARTATGIAGSGIGLNLVRQIVQMHGGCVMVASEEGHGTTFTVRCPIEQAGSAVRGSGDGTMKPPQIDQGWSDGRFVSVVTQTGDDAHGTVL